MSTERESAPHDTSEHSEFERRVATLLNDSADALDGRTRSALTRARHAALAEATAPRSARWRAWAPVGALATGLLVVVFFVGQHGGVQSPVAGASGGVTDDLGLLTDVDGYELSMDTEMDLDSDFYEWAAASSAASGGKRGIGS